MRRALADRSDPEPTTAQPHESGTMPVSVPRRGEIEMEACLATGDFDGALVWASAVLFVQPDNARAKLIKAESFRHARKLTTQTVPPETVLARRVELREAARFGLRREEAFLLTFIDGKATCEQVLDMSGLAPARAYAALAHLVELQLVAPV